MFISCRVGTQERAARSARAALGEVPMRRTARWALMVVVALAATLVPLASAVPPAAADAPNLTSGFGITVGGWRWITARTLEVDISTAKVSANAVNGPHRVRITLPNDYFTSGTT